MSFRMGVLEALKGTIRQSAAQIWRSINKRRELKNPVSNVMLSVSLQLLSDNTEQQTFQRHHELLLVKHQTDDGGL